MKTPQVPPMTGMTPLGVKPLPPSQPYAVSDEVRIGIEVYQLRKEPGTSLCIWRKRDDRPDEGWRLLMSCATPDDCARYGLKVASNEATDDPDVPVKRSSLIAAAQERGNLIRCITNLAGSIRHSAACRAPNAFPCTCDADRLALEAKVILDEAKAKERP